MVHFFLNFISIYFLFLFLNFVCVCLGEGTCMCVQVPRDSTGAGDTDGCEAPYMILSLGPQEE